MYHTNVTCSLHSVLVLRSGCVATMPGTVLGTLKQHEYSKFRKGVAGEAYVA